MTWFLIYFGTSYKLPQTLCYAHWLTWQEYECLLRANESKSEELIYTLIQNLVLGTASSWTVWSTVFRPLFWKKRKYLSYNFQWTFIEREIISFGQNISPNYLSFTKLSSVDIAVMWLIENRYVTLIFHICINVKYVCANQREMSHPLGIQNIKSKCRSKLILVYW